VLCVDDTHRLLSFGLRERGWSVTNWNRFTRRDRRGAPWPPAVRLPFDAATIRLPPTKAAFAMAATAVAARVKAGGIVWVYGADREGVRGCASDLPTGLFERCVVVHTENQKPDGSSSDGSPHGSSHVEDSTGGFAALRCVRTDRDPSADVAADDESGFKSRSNLRLELPGHRAHDVDGWVTYPGLFAGGGLDVMTDFLLQTMTASKTCALGGGRGGNGGDEVLSALDFCSGSGTLAAAVRFVRPHARLTLLDADAVAMLAARENLSVVRDGSSSGVGSFQPATFVLSDGWTGLADDEKFDLVVSNPPVHLGLRPEFTVLSDMIAGFEERLNPGGEAWFVAQRYVPIAGICAELGGLAASVICAGVNEKFAAWTVRKPGGDASLPEANTPKKDKKDKGAKKEKSAKKEKKEKKDKSAKKEKR
jgi:16S rRNA G1207 methylase RsmC